MKNVKAKTNEQIAMQVSANSIAVNLMLSIFKLIAGLLASSGAMISDAIHSASDVFSTIIVIIGVKISGKASDEDHPYGHDRFECVASIILAILLGVTGVGIGLTGVQKLTAGHYDTLADLECWHWRQLLFLSLSRKSCIGIQEMQPRRLTQGH